MTHPRGRTRRRETPFAYVGLILAAVFVLAATTGLATGGGRWAVLRLVVALAYAAYALWFFRRARRRDRAADAAGPPPP